MFYVRHKLNGKLGIVDTQDGICEYYTEEEIKSFGVDIKPELTEDYFPSLEQRMGRKLYYLATRGEASEFFDKYCLPSLDKKVIVTGLLKCWAYNETHGLMVLILKCDNGIVVLVVREDGINWSACFKGDWRFSFYPIGGGRLYNLLFKRNVNLDTNLDEKLLYILTYSSNKAYLIRVGDLAIKEVCEVKEDLK